VEWIVLIMLKIAAQGWIADFNIALSACGIKKLRLILMETRKK